MIKAKEEIFKYYFYFIQERMNIFWNKYNGYKKLTNDEILKSNKFTNVYRSTDRISQYLIKNIIYKKGNFEKEDILLRILIFKIFNKAETFEYLENKLGEISIKNFNLNKMNQALSDLKENQAIFNNAYIMTGSHSKYNHLHYKHEKWLKMLKLEMIEGSILKQIINANSLSEIFNLLKSCSLIGDFLAYQYAIDMNYSEFINFDENSFVKAGIGAIRGIKKCFYPLGENTYEDAIKYTQKNFLKYQEKFGYTKFKTLFNRQPTLIDLQNCFCETDKYLRAKMPELKLGNKRIKQKYKYEKKPIKFFFPPKWNIKIV